MRSAFGNILPVVRMVAQRATGHGRLFAAMTTGAIISAALMACVIIYSDAIRDLGLAYAIRSQPERAIDVEVLSSSQSFVGQEYAIRKSTTEGLLQAQAGSVLKDVVRYARTSTFYLSPPGQQLSTDDNRPRSHLQYADRLASEVRIVEGRAPQPMTAPGAARPPVEVWAGVEAARALGFGVGSTFDLYPSWRSDLAPFTVVVVGLIEPIDLSRPYWFGKTDRFQMDTTWPTYPFFVPDEATLTQGLAAYYPDLDGSFETYGFIDQGKINAANAGRIAAQMRALNDGLRARVQFTLVNSTLADTIARYQDQLFFTRLPLFALMVQIVGIALFYLVMVSTAVVERQAGEVALMKSRGASSGQVLGVFAIEGLGVTIIATAIGPLIAALAIAFLGLTPPFEQLSNGKLLDVSLGPYAFGLAGFGALMAFGALIWPAYRASRLSINLHKQQVSRPQAQPAFLRYYLDLVVVGVGAFAFYQLQQRGSLVTQSVFGDLSADPLLLATPSLFMLMTALVFLRLFPLALRLVIWLTRRLNGATISLGLTRMARAPVQHSRLILLLILTTAVGMFAAGFRATLEKGYEDRAAYRAGSELRVADVREPSPQPAGPFRAAVERFIPGRTSSLAARMSGSYSATRLRSSEFTLLGIEPVPFAQVAYWRSDFAAEPLSALLERIRYESPPLPARAPIPDGARWIGVWMRLELPPNQLQPGIRLIDADGGAWEYRLAAQANALNTNWQFMLADLRNPLSRPGGLGRPGPGSQLVFPRGATLDAVFINMPGQQPQNPQNLTALIDDVTVGSATPPSNWGNAGLSDGQVVETFDDVTRYELVRGVTQAGNPGALAAGAAGGGREGNVVRLSFVRGGRGAQSMVGVRTAGDNAPLNILASQTFLNEQGKKVGDTFVVYVNRQYVDVRIAGRFDLFPGYDPKKDPDLFVADLAAVQARAARVPFFGGMAYPNEAWFGPGAGTYIREALAEQGFRTEQLLDRPAILAEQRSDPLVAASWEGILFLAFAAVLILSGLGFVIYSGLSAKTRSLEFAILRTMGLSGKQILGVVSFEQIFVIASGVLTGTLLGFPLSRLMIGYMGLTEDGADPLPPLLSRVSWQAVATVYTLLGIVVVATVISLVVLYSRVAVSRALRAGDL